MAERISRYHKVAVGPWLQVTYHSIGYSRIHEVPWPNRKTNFKMNLEFVHYDLHPRTRISVLFFVNNLITACNRHVPYYQNDITDNGKKYPDALLRRVDLPLKQKQIYQRKVYFVEAHHIKSAFSTDRAQKADAAFYAVPPPLLPAALEVLLHSLGVS